MLYYKSMYVIDDFIGDVDFRTEATKSARVRKAILAKFEARAEVATKELQKLLPNTSLDHSRESLVAIDAWLPQFLDSAVADLPALPYSSVSRRDDGVWMEGPSPFNALTPLIRSVFSDVFIYYFETLRHHFPKTTIAQADGKSGNYWSSAGFPGYIGHPGCHGIRYGQLWVFLGRAADYASRSLTKEVNPPDPIRPLGMLLYEAFDRALKVAQEEELSRGDRNE